MIVGVLGCGRMGGALAGALDRMSCPVLVAGARPASAARLAAALRHGSAADVSSLVRTASILVLALPFAVALEVMSGGYARAGAGRTLIDPTNPALGPGPAAPMTRSGGETIAARLPSWRVVKAFNSVPATMIGTPRLSGHPVTLPIASDHRQAKAEVSVLAGRLGFEPVDVGSIARSRELESLAALLAAISRRYGRSGQVGFHLAWADAGNRQPAPAAGLAGKLHVALE